MGAKRKSCTPSCRRDAARLVIDTGRTIAQIAREIGVGEQLFGPVGPSRAGPDGRTRPRHWMLMSGPSWNDSV